MQKILFIGLDGAGKTAIYQRFFGKKPPAQLLNIPPTRGTAKYKHDFLRSDVEIIDAGRGKQFRQCYIGNTELTKNLSAVVYIVDVQDVKNYQEAANYLILWTKSIADKVVPAMPATIKCAFSSFGILGTNPFATSVAFGITNIMLVIKHTPMIDTNIIRSFSNLTYLPTQSK